MPPTLRAAVLASSLALVALTGARSGRAEIPGAATPPDAPALAPLLARTAQHAAQFEEMKRRGSFTVSGRMEEVDGSGKVDAVKEMIVRSTATPAERLTEIVRYTEDGADKTAEARQKADKSRAERKAKNKPKDPKKEMHLPFLASEQPRYAFAYAERDPKLLQTRIVFHPLLPGETTFRGSAWLDESTGEILTIAFAPSKTPTFVDRIDVTMRFDLRTPLGRAPSSIAFDAKGGFLFVRKHYRGSVTITDPGLGF